MEAIMKRILCLGVLSSLLFVESSHAAPEPLQQVSAEMAAAANALLAALDETPTAKARFPFKSEERESWGFVPRARKGIPLNDLNEEQVALVRSLLKTALSQPGLEKVDAVMTLEAFLGEIEKRPEFRNPDAYFTSIFGEPAATGTWGWRYEGHHLSLNYTIVDGAKVAVTPSFFASNPGEILIEHKLKGMRPFHAEEDLARALALTLKEGGKDVVYTEKPPGDILTGEDRKATQLKPVGLRASEFTAAQKDALITLIAEYAERHRRELSESDLAKIKADFDHLRFGWAGSLKRGEPYYYRIQGTTFLVEVANVQNNGNHFHGVWRDVANDFGRDLLGEHIGHEH